MSYADEAARAHLTPEKATEAVTHLAGLPSAERDDDELDPPKAWLDEGVVCSPSDVTLWAASG